MILQGSFKHTHTHAQAWTNRLKGMQIYRDKLLITRCRFKAEWKKKKSHLVALSISTIAVNQITRGGGGD